MLAILGGNIGDSWCAMARIAWFDARGRKRFGTTDDLNYFNSRLLAPVQRDVLQNTWMHEREEQHCWFCCCLCMWIIVCLYVQYSIVRYMYLIFVSFY